MTHLKKFWWAYGLAVVAIIVIAMNWETVKGWFSAAGATLRKKCTNDGRGNCSYNGQSVACSACADRGLL